MAECRATLAALVSATLSLARQATAETGRGEFREALARGTNGYLMVYAADSSAVVAVLADARVKVGMLRYQAREPIERITACAADFVRWSGATGVAGAVRFGQGGPGSL